MAAAPRTNDSRKISLNLDSVKYEPSTAEPFTFTIKSRPITLIESDLADWKKMNNSDPAQILQGLMTEEDFKFFYAQDVKIFQIKAVLDAWMKHYGVNPGNS